MSERPRPENTDWRVGVDPKNLDINRLVNSHKLRTSQLRSITSPDIMADSIENTVFEEARVKTLKDRKKEEAAER